MRGVNSHVVFALVWLIVFVRVPRCGSFVPQLCPQLLVLLMHAHALSCFNGFVAAGPVDAGIQSFNVVGVFRKANYV